MSVEGGAGGGVSADVAIERNKQVDVAGRLFRDTVEHTCMQDEATEDMGD